MVLPIPGATQGVPVEVSTSDKETLANRTDVRLESPPTESKATKNANQPTSENANNLTSDQKTYDINSQIMSRDGRIQEALQDQEPELAMCKPFSPELNDRNFNPVRR